MGFNEIGGALRTGGDAAGTARGGLTAGLPRTDCGLRYKLGKFGRGGIGAMVECREFIRAAIAS